MAWLTHEIQVVFWVVTLCRQVTNVS